MSSQPGAPGFIPTVEQERALTDAAPLLVLAGPGTGKTTVLTHRIARTILELGAEPASILALTFTDKAASEMAERLTDVLGAAGRAEAAHEVAVGTFHSFGGRIVREHLLDLGFDRSPSVLTTPGSWQLLAACFDSLTFDAIDIPLSVGAHFGHLLKLFSACKDSLIGPDDLAAYAGLIESQPATDVAAEYLRERAATLREAAAAYERYEQEKRARGLIDFGDHLYLPVRLMRERAEVRDELRRRYPLVFVDEYQDTNLAQRELLMQILEPERPSIVVIGDDDQSIYGWRGALVENILQFGKERAFERCPVRQLTLTLNRRSFPPILDLANDVISAVVERHSKRVTYHPKNEGGRATIGRHVAASDGDEGKWIAERIEALHAETAGYEGKKRGYGAFAVLCRRRSLFEPICQALDRRHVPYELVGGTGFFGRWEIKDVLSYLMILADHEDDVALARILRSRRWRLSGRDLFHLGQWAGERRRAERPESADAEGISSTRLLRAVLRSEQVPGLSPVAMERLRALAGELRALDRLHRALPLGEFVGRLIDFTGYRRELAALPGFDARAALMNLDKLEQMARDFGDGEEGSLRAFVEYVRYSMDSRDEESEVRPVDEERDTVKVMTVHAAKGLEFPVVFVPGLSVKVFPTGGRSESESWHALPTELRDGQVRPVGGEVASAKTKKALDEAKKARKAAEQARQLDEERRLFYVAVTRAERHLYLTRAWYYGSAKNPKDGSEFWEVVAASEAVADMGADDPPATNPSLQPAGPAATGASAEAAHAREAVGALAAGRVAEWLAGAGVTADGDAWTALRAEVDAHLRALAERSPVEEPSERPVVSCSALITYLACPRRYRNVYVDRLPVRPSWRARLGDEVHERIAALASGVAAWPDEGIPPREDADSDADGPPVPEPPDPLDEPDERHPADADTLVDRYRASRYGGRVASEVEWPFELPLAAGTLRGRIDRLDRIADEGGVRWEVVDFKTGRQYPEAREHYRRQLELYALAVRRQFGAPAGRIGGHLLFLQDNQEIDEAFDDASLGAAGARAEAALAAIARREYPEAHGPACPHCDYGHLCGERLLI